MLWLSWNAHHFTRYGGQLYFQHIIKPRFGIGEPDPKVVEEATGFFKQYAQVLNDHLAGRKYLLGDTLTIADFSVAVTLPYAETADCWRSGSPVGRSACTSRAASRAGCVRVAGVRAGASRGACAAPRRVYSSRVADPSNNWSVNSCSVRLTGQAFFESRLRDSTIAASSAKPKASIFSDCNPGGVLATDQSVQSSRTAKLPSSGWRTLNVAT